MTIDLIDTANSRKSYSFVSASEALI